MAGRVIRLKELITHTGLSRSAIYDRMDPHSPRHDPSFPRSFSLGGAAVGWYLEEVDRWLKGCAQPDQRQAVTRRPMTVASGRHAESTDESNANSAGLMTRSGDMPSATSLADALAAGGQLNAKLIGYLSMDTWSPVMAALLVSGIEPPTDCEDIPLGGIGLDGKNLHASNGRFHDARRVLKAWNFVDEEEDEPPRPSSFTPLEFLVWCLDEERIESDWLRYLVELGGIKGLGAPDFSAARLELALRKAKLR